MKVTFIAKMHHQTSARTIENRRLRRMLRRFRRDEDGSLLIFGLFAFVIMLLLAGVSLDLMRFEDRRTRVQNVLDRASLAAAERQQAPTPKDVVRDYFEKAGLPPPADRDIVVTQPTLDAPRRVDIRVTNSISTWFMGLLGVQTLEAPAASAAREGINQIEVSLVLDVSGSMNSNNRIANLRPAAKSFIDKLFASTAPGKVSVSIIPYATQVALSDDLAGYLNMTTEHFSSNCIEFEEAEGDFDTMAVAFGSGLGGRVYQRNGHFDPFNLASPPKLTNCPTEESRAILPLSGDPIALKDRIDDLAAAGNTSIDIGMKWGAALLDPSMSVVVDGMIAAKKRPATFSKRPYPYDNGDVLKIIVLMTDGANTAEYRLRNDTKDSTWFDQGASYLERNPYYRKNGVASDDWSIEQYSLYDSRKRKYFIYAINDWRDEAWGNNPGDTGYNGSNTTIPMSWPDVWHDMSMYWFSDNIIYTAYGRTTLRNKWRPNHANPTANTSVDDTKDAHTLAMCNAAKNKGIRIYTIAFEAPAEGQRLLDACQNAGYYAVEGRNITDAFLGIVDSINKLRLTF